MRPYIRQKPGILRNRKATGVGKAQWARGEGWEVRGLFLGREVHEVGREQVCM